MPGPRIIDEAHGPTRQGYVLTRIYAIGDDRVKTEINRDAYSFQSWATAWVLTPDRTWTKLADQPASNWFDDTPLDTDDPRSQLGRLADDLADRAATILGAPS